MKNLPGKKPFSGKNILEYVLILFLLILMAAPAVAGWTIKNAINSSGSGSVSHCFIHLFNRGIIIRDIQLDAFQVNENYQLSGTADYFEISNIPIGDLLFHKEINFPDLEVGKANLTVKQQHIQVKKASRETVPLSINNIQNLEIKKSNLVFTDSAGTYETRGLHVSLSPLDYFSEKGSDSELKFRFSSEKTTYQTSNGLYLMSAYELQGSSDYNIIIVDSFKVTPRYGEREFAQKVKYQTDRYDIACPRISVNFTSAIEPFHAKTVKFQSPVINVFRDKGRPRNPDVSFSTLQTYLAQSKFKFEIDSVLIEGGNICYREYVDKSYKTGEIKFEDAAIAIGEIKSEGVKGEALTVTFDSRLMQSGKIKALLAFPYETKSISCKGELVNFQITEINKISFPSAGLLFSDGTIHSCKFNFTADGIATGNLTLDYSDLHFKVGDRKEGDTKGFMGKVKSAIASVVVKKGNEDRKDMPRHGNICYTRREDRFVINYIWKSILSGLRSAMLLPDFDNESNDKSPC